MSLCLSGTCLPPSSILPPVRSLCSASEEQIAAALHHLHSVYCPLRLPVTLPKQNQRLQEIPAAPTPDLVDSGYASQDEDDDISNAKVALDILRADEFERSFTTRWLTSLISRADEFQFASEESQARIIDDAAFILSSFSDSSAEPGEEALTRDFSFPLSSSLVAKSAGAPAIEIRLNDAPLSGTDHTDVGLQSWGASIILSGLMCERPKHFGFDRFDVQTSSTIIELGAGTGLVGLTVAKLSSYLEGPLPSILATDYHPAVLENLESNIATNFPSALRANAGRVPIETMLLDWSMPPSFLRSSSCMLLAADVVYAPEHARWLRDCAAHLLMPEGSFWLIVTVRTEGKFEGIADTVETAFAETDDVNQGNLRKLKILEKESLEKKRGVGRGDETGYVLYRIGWA